METSSDLYADVVATYLQVIRQYSPLAAAAVDEILSTCGSRAALRATLVLTMVKMEVQKRPADQNIRLHMYLIRDFPAALPLLERAITAFLQARTVAALELPGSAGIDVAGATEEPSVPINTLPPTLVAEQRSG